MTISGVPLTDEQKTLPSGALLPSGEAMFFDITQAHSADGSGINATFPSPTFSDSYWNNSGIYKTYGPNNDLLISDRSGILHYDHLTSQFSNASGAMISGIRSFTIFNPYIHHYALSTPTNIQTSQPVKIPYISDYTISATYDVYSL